jgi:uncharacterized protein (TIGR03437 family)
VRVNSKILLGLAIAPLVCQAYEYGPDARYTAAPGDNKTACINAGCHTGTVNSGTGSIRINAGGTTYTPGAPMTISVTITDATKVKYGFELTARLASDTINGQAGDFSPGSDGFTQVICDDSNPKPAGGPCNLPSPFSKVQFIEHTLQGYEASTKGAFTFTFTWMPPAASAGNVILYAAGNAGPGDPPVQTPTNVYTTNITLTPGAGPTAPAINTGGVVPIFSAATSIQSGSWISIYGSNFATGTTVWNGDFPTHLGGVTVSIDGQPAYIWFVGATQMNVQVPDDTKTGSVNVSVTNAGGIATATVTLAQASPSWSLLDTKHVAGIIVRTDKSGAYGGGTYDIIGPTGSALGYATKAVKAGDFVELFGVGFGPTNPAVQAGKAYSGVAPTANAVNVTISGTSITPAFAGLTGAGLFQINLQIPPGLPSGDQTLSALVAGVQTPAGVVISTQ